jgi:hypothetical protein
MTMNRRTFCSVSTHKKPTKLEYDVIGCYMMCTLVFSVGLLISLIAGYRSVASTSSLARGVHSGESSIQKWMRNTNRISRAKDLRRRGHDATS